MLDYLTEKRNDAITKAMKDAAVRGDDLADQPDMKRPRKVLIDDIAPIVPVELQISGDNVTMQMLSTWHGKHKLFIEASESNVNYLLGEPGDISTRYALDEPNVKWAQHRHSCYCLWYDGDMKKWRQHYEMVLKVVEEAEQRRLVCKVAARVQQFYNTHHADPEEEDHAVPEEEEDAVPESEDHAERHAAVAEHEPEKGVEGINDSATSETS